MQRARNAFWSKIEQDFGTKHDVFVYKLPLSIGTINAIFPSAKIIVALRDPRDVCLSCLFQYFGLNRSMKKFLAWQTTYEYYAHVMGFWLAVRDQIDLSFIEVKYEDTDHRSAPSGGALAGPSPRGLGRSGVVLL